MNNYSLQVLAQAVCEYFQTEEDLRVFLKDRKPGWWESADVTEKRRYTELDERNTAAWNTVLMMCKLVQVDSNTFIPIMKAINRWERNHGKWDRCFHWSSIEYSQSENLRKTISSFEDFFDDQHYLSTGRRIKA